MSSKIRIEDNTVLRDKPYVTKSELSVILGKTDRNLDKAILNLVSQERLITLKNGIYLFQEASRPIDQTQTEFLANILRFPSYVSLEYVLQQEQIIPEMVFAVTSITTRTTSSFTNKIATFQYRSIKQSLFTGFSLSPYRHNYQIKRATIAKALFDWLYLMSFPRSLRDMRRVLDDTRLNYNSLTSHDLSEFSQYVTISGSPKMAQLAQLLREGVSNVT